MPLRGVSHFALPHVWVTATAALVTLLIVLPHATAEVLPWGSFARLDTPVSVNNIVSVDGNITFALGNDGTILYGQRKDTYSFTPFSVFDSTGNVKRITLSRLKDGRLILIAATSNGAQGDQLQVRFEQARGTNSWSTSWFSLKFNLIEGVVPYIVSNIKVAEMTDGNLILGFLVKVEGFKPADNMQLYAHAIQNRVDDPINWADIVVSGVDCRADSDPVLISSTKESKLVRLFILDSRGYFYNALYNEYQLGNFSLITSSISESGYYDLAFKSISSAQNRDGTYEILLIGNLDGELHRLRQRRTNVTSLDIVGPDDEAQNLEKVMEGAQNLDGLLEVLAISSDGTLFRKVQESVNGGSDATDWSSWNNTNAGRVAWAQAIPDQKGNLIMYTIRQDGAANIQAQAQPQEVVPEENREVEEKKEKKSPNLVPILVPIITGVAALCTIAYTSYKCILKRKFFREIQQQKLAMAQDAVKGAPVESFKTEKKRGNKNENAEFKDVEHGMPPSRMSSTNGSHLRAASPLLSNSYKSVNEGMRADPVNLGGNSFKRYNEEGPGPLPQNDSAYLHNREDIYGNNMHGDGSGNLPPYMVPPHLRKV